MKNLALILIITFFGTACSSQKKSSQLVMQESKYIKVAEEKLLGASIEYIANTDSSLMLCLTEQEGSVQVPQNRINYIIVDTKTGLVVRENSVFGGSVKWYNNDHIQVFQTPGIMAEGQTADDYTQVINARTGESKVKTQFKQ